MTKICRVCKEVKPIDLFHKRGDSPDGYRNDCKSCFSIKSKTPEGRARKSVNDKKYREGQGELLLVKKREHYANNRETILASQKIYQQNNKQAANIRANRWARKHKGQKNAMTVAYRARKARRKPVWADDDKIKQMYINASQQGLEVDHIIPLHGDTVSGLHVHGNMQLMTRADNASKSNNYEI